ncbi:Ribosome biogenesis protein BRX1 [Nymphon striatum]|nr:Ribosome biogenesis protein BRX1 [Nymphon striatum]
MIILRFLKLSTCSSCSSKWKNKQRVLVFAGRGISHRGRHLMKNLQTLFPHSKSDSKMERKDQISVINEIAEIKNCNKCIYFECRGKRDLYMWISNTPNGPSAKFLVENVHTMEELKMTGNCLKGSRPILSFDKNFDKLPHLSLLKEVFVQTFGTPNHHPKSQPFLDHVFSFSYVDNRIWFRNYQIVEEDASLTEIGPRFVLNLIKIFNGSFGGSTQYNNVDFVTPSLRRRQLKAAAASKYVNRIHAKKAYEFNYPKVSYHVDETEEIFENDEVPPPSKKIDEIPSNESLNIQDYPVHQRFFH